MPYIPSMEEVRGYADPAPNWRWVVAMPILPGIKGAPYVGLNPVFEMPFGMVERLDFNLPQIDTDPRAGMASRSSYPRFVTVSNISISFYEDVLYTQTRYLRTWQNLIIDDNYMFGLPIEYKMDITLFAFDYVSNTAPAMVGLLTNTFPVNISGLTYAYDQSNRIVVNADFVIDEMFVTGGGGATGGAGGGAGAGSLLGNVGNQFAQQAIGQLQAAGAQLLNQGIGVAQDAIADGIADVADGFNPFSGIFG